MTENKNPMGSCPECGSEKIEIMTRVTGFFSKVNSWNKGKIGELKKRRDAIHANKGALEGSSLTKENN
ncbi:MAG: anaerobic ribonucleoside-triphosphate reductase [Candidatus Undinarchaeales archaeon]|jgi:ribonucleoside-triphosphate reductase|nr:anaerobic ribonucleoside-triphosphate reductase [Candidatus Undinarchaeales archaeon]